ncbi:MAG TPA: hypothetical protein VLL75_16775 [Vicinamibacteria bacterium]|nr:hypothetical protein [Vicinamibacteria bacterium]
MRRLRDLVPVVALATLAGGGCSARTSNVLGRPVTLVPREDGAPKEKGELLAVDQGRIWLRTKEGVRDFDPASLREVRVRRHNLTGAWAVRWGLVGGLASGLAMTAACSSVEGSDGGGCARAGAFWGGLWVLAGLLAAPSLDASSQVFLDPQSGRLRPYARLPAGLPAGVSPESLVQGPPAPR